jgi:hypothetical protein
VRFAIKPIGIMRRVYRLSRSSREGAFRSDRGQLVPSTDFRPKTVLCSPKTSNVRVGGNPTATAEERFLRVRLG